VPEAADRPRTVLVVEDEDPVRRLAVRQFTLRGWQVLEAEDGEVACELLAEAPDQRLDLVVSDVVMPGLDGPSLVRLLREERPRLPAILVSGYADEKLRRDLAREDIVFIPKPYNLKQLIEAASALLAV
jgi:two-component system cell cycle sensor histidine kinase/response regulator CckA